ncbi:hypothetical protein [Psychroserpens sp.]|uniref:hypothetical protein n=1 Tax=Psychroserpens sp. TaxID=2020870 RepID=UPI002B270802|nr:hypothetical protein [Psychroserpens sp.]
MLLIQYRKREWYEDYLHALEQVPWIFILIGIVILFIVLRRTKKEFHSHWNTLIPNFTYLSKDFYAQFKKELLSHGIEGVTTSFVSLKEGGITSSKRLYLRILWKNYQYDVCCAPFGDGLFLSSWLMYRTSVWQIIISHIPFIGGWLIRKFYKITYYKVDTASMFMTYCHQTVLKITDEITKESGIRISDADRKPILKDIFKR